MIIGVTRAGAAVDVSLRPPVPPVQPVSPVTRSWERPAATFELSDPVPELQAFYGPPTNAPEI